MEHPGWARRLGLLSAPPLPFHRSSFSEFFFFFFFSSPDYWGRCGDGLLRRSSKSLACVLLEIEEEEEGRCYLPIQAAMKSDQRKGNAYLTRLPCFLKEQVLVSNTQSFPVSCSWGFTCPLGQYEPSTATLVPCVGAWWGSVVMLFLAESGQAGTALCEDTQNKKKLSVTLKTESYITI